MHGWVAGGPGPLALSVVLTGGARACRLLATEVLLEALLHELRTQENLIYSAQSYVAAIGPDARLAAVLLDPTSADLLPAAAAAVAVLRRLADEGPSEELLEFVLLDWENAMAHPETHQEALQDLVVLPDDWRGGAKLVAHLERLIPQHVRHPTEQRSAEPSKTDHAAARHHPAASASGQRSTSAPS